MASMVRTTPIKKTAAKSHRNFDFQTSSLFWEGSATLASLSMSDEVAVESATVCEMEPTVRGLLLKTASRFIE
jgi:hypothetical protein